MNTYKIYATMYEYGHFIVQADSEDAAREIVAEGEAQFISRDAGCDLEEIEMLENIA